MNSASSPSTAVLLLLLIRTSLCTWRIRFADCAKSQRPKAQRPTMDIPLYTYHQTCKPSFTKPRVSTLSKLPNIMLTNTMLARASGVAEHPHVRMATILWCTGFRLTNCISLRIVSTDNEQLLQVAKWTVYKVYAAAKCVQSEHEDWYHLDDLRRSVLGGTKTNAVLRHVPLEKHAPIVVSTILEHTNSLRM